MQPAGSKQNTSVLNKPSIHFLNLLLEFFSLLFFFSGKIILSIFFLTERSQ